MKKKNSLQKQQTIKWNKLNANRNIQAMQWIVNINVQRWKKKKLSVNLSAIFSLQRPEKEKLININHWDGFKVGKNLSFFLNTKLE